jgi:hypothetical protein
MEELGKRKFGHCRRPSCTIETENEKGRMRGSRKQRGQQFRSVGIELGDGTKSKTQYACGK